MTSRLFALPLALACLAIPLAPSGAAAQTAPITVVVPYAPGGASDQITRLVLNAAARHLNETVVIENRPGAGGILAAQAVEKAAPDGRTLLVGSNAPLVINLGLYDKLPYDAEAFVPVAGLGRSPLLLVTGASVPGASVKDLVSVAQKQGKPWSMGSASNGNITHLGGVSAAQALGIDVMHVPFQGSTPAITALAGGNLDIMFDALPSALPQVRAGRLKAWAILDKERFAGLPEVPTLAEQGYPGNEASAWFALVAPKGTPDAAVSRMNTAVNAALAEPAVQAGLTTIGAQPMPGDAQALAAFMAAEKRQWLPVVKATGIKAD